MKAIKNFEYQAPKMRQDPYRKFIISALQELVNNDWNPEVRYRAQKEIVNVLTGWKLGVVVHENVKLNQSTRELHSRPLPEQVAILKYVCEEIEGGRIGREEDLLPLGEVIKNYIPWRPLDKERGDDVDFLTLLYGKVRLARHCGHSTKDTFSINDCTPPINWQVILPRTKQLCMKCVKAGKYCLMAKGDEKDSFRQLGIHQSNWKYEGYKVLNYKLVDTRDIYGSRAASKHKQEFGVIIIKAFLHWLKKQMDPNTFEQYKAFIDIYIDDYMIFITSRRNSNKKVEQWIINKFGNLLKNVV